MVDGCSLNKGDDHNDDVEVLVPVAKTCGRITHAHRCEGRRDCW
ncbi:hypothetical protein THF1C08_10565 [Vibrio jasicida]|uniref:Transposase n=1 Tax=Vibrio jasicida TaxID=766224 RepID=A0AAU9QG91_9VIBR|nr:hypothetical protein THF1C08_10565 [Vibrio jasicida]CAH1567216.1 hypothetical protein THF1A12_10567 [Vibrio jasicida]